MGKIIVYTTPSCPYCTMAKDFLRDKGAEFEEIDVSSNRDAANAMIEKSGNMGVPQIEINGKTIIGFNQKAIEEELARM